MIGLDTMVFERVRASLRGSPFRFSLKNPMEESPAEEPDLYIAPTQDMEGLSATGTPVIACGPGGLLRSAFLGGCADYLREPWTPEELELRALAVLSRARKRFQFPWGAISIEGKDLCTPTGTVPLTHHESRLVRLLLRARGEPVPRTAIACELWGSPAHASGRAVDMHVTAVRKKLNRLEPRAGRFITCVRGRGYMIP